jgi:hypothetical protein
MDHSRHPVAYLDPISHFGPDSFHDATVVAANYCAGAGKIVNVLPIGRVQSHRLGFDENIVIAELGNGSVGNDFGLASFFNADCFHFVLGKMFNDEGRL